MTEFLDNHLEEFEEWVENSSSSRTATNYRHSVKTFYKETGNPVIQPGEIDDEKLSKLAQQLSTSVSSRSMKYALKKYFDFLDLRCESIDAQRNIQFLQNKLDKMSYQVKTSDVGEKLLSPGRVVEEVEEAYKKERELGLMFQIMYETCARASGVFLMQWEDVEREEYQGEPLQPTDIFISKERSKSKENGIVQISQDSLQELRELKKQTHQPSPSEKVFYPDLKRTSVYDKMWRHTKEKEYSTHWFRHSGLTHRAMNMRKDGNDFDKILGKLQRYARHSNKSDTETYIDLVKEKMKADDDLGQHLVTKWK